MIVDKQLNYGRKQIVEFVKEEALGKKSIAIMDIGAGHGTDLINAKNALDGINVFLYGVEGYEPNQNELKNQGVYVCGIDIEKDCFPYEDSSMDIIISNQVLEHTKEVFWIFSEISRVLKKGGVCVVGVPNLASLHNRLLLLVGKQPTFIRTLGPHVRGYTYKDFKNFIETDGYFVVEKVKGANFYPFSPMIAKMLAKVFPKASASIVIKVRRTHKEGVFIDIFKERFFETNYYRGAGKTIFDKRNKDE